MTGGGSVVGARCVVRCSKKWWSVPLRIVIVLAAQRLCSKWPLLAGRVRCGRTRNEERASNHRRRPSLTPLSSFF